MGGDCNLRQTYTTVQCRGLCTRTQVGVVKPCPERCKLCLNLDVENLLEDLVASPSQLLNLPTFTQPQIPKLMSSSVGTCGFACHNMVMDHSRGTTDHVLNLSHRIKRN